MYRQEYPRPQFVREQWLNLNGVWSFSFDDENVGTKNKWFDSKICFDNEINVPFAYQTKISGIHDPSFHDHVWYKKTFSLNKDWSNQRIILHFGAVDYRAWVYVNGKYVGFHEGGHTAFSFDITEYLTWGEETVALHVEDPSTDETIPRGKQFWQEESDAIWYTRTTGIWQTVWIEPVNSNHLSSLRLTPDVDQGNINLEFEVSGDHQDTMVEVEIKFKNQLVVKDMILVIENYNARSINLYNQYIFRTGFHHEGWNWSPENPNLFDIKLTLKNSREILDEVQSYFGMRKIHTENGMVYLNNKPYYQKLVLDQGYWPDGLLTAPSDEDFKKDIILSREMGFNGCRKHQKVEDPRFLYWADKLGYLVWGECAASPSFSEKAASRLTKEWVEIVDRDYNHPSIVTWVPVNESWGVPYIRTNSQQQHHSLALYHLIHSLDTTRLVISNDGWELTETDICAIHNYNHGNEEEKLKYMAFEESLSSKDSILLSRPAGRGIYANGFTHRGEPILLTEFGGIGYKVGEEQGWGYTSVKDGEQYLKDYERILNAVYASKILHGFCYTQLTDVEQEINGLLTYDRKPKVELEKIKEINNRWHSTIITE
ncbi:glycoside hydrolase family 2 TIM barrel-domain containing protein [Pullulanibacillus sp. KACC 23026]|uniref:glycoside hydrolase family 2 protein n=1 Tax=Pullulanibacillus sp. KACC 23026 TaxID=3028315 RepID=UPI0023AF9FA3|nr:sugar-binding domain-containing protein [Pullulanibacillus sp. KACC 23026]WEG12837.1 glycoside hydrolase family 2 TIM barrel-domain containing protein [Pullulanibacillus sp. KACC 23026]